jgi:hypothetical protein
VCSRAICSRAVVVAMVATSLVWLTGKGTAGADTLNTPIAVPLIGTQGPAGAYPSRQVIAARGGPSQTGQVRISLYNVTHPCPDELAVLLVRNNTEKYLLMSNAGGCRPLQGSTLDFEPTAAPIPDTPPASPPLGASTFVGASNYGPRPVFPAPAPAGPYIAGLPPPGGVISGNWDLYVMDTTAGNRGVIASGWSFNYITDVSRSSAQTPVALPATGTGPGGAAAYPITFDFSDVPAGVPVKLAYISITLQHTFPDDIRMVLQSPTGTAVALMANAGGDINIAPGTSMKFIDGGAPLTDAGAITTGTYAPGAVFGAGADIAAPAPSGPFAMTMAAFNDQPLRGIWRLWAVDDAAADSGQITSATLVVETEVPPLPMLSPAPPATHNQPFVRVEGTVSNTSTVSPHSAEWRVTNGGTFYEAGPFVFEPGTNRFSADIPLKKGANLVTYRVQNTRRTSSTASFNTTVNEFTYSFAEGATGSFFDLDLTLANPSGASAPISIDFLPEGGGTLTHTGTIDPNAPFPLAVDSVVPDAAVSSVVHSTNGVALAAERTMIWDSTGYGGHGGTAVGPATRWLFAEGSQGFFNTFVLLANDNATDAAVTVRFLVEGGGVVDVPVTVAARTRRTIFAGGIGALVNQSFGIDVTSSLPIIAERAMYLPGERVFEGGHESAGVNAPSRQWFLAEGATGTFFDCFILLSNPNATDANATITYLLPEGATIVKPVAIPANSRVTINVETVDPLLAAADVSTTIVSDIGIVAERAQYWPNISQGWREAHNSFGVTTSALRWGLADGRIGGPRAFQTFILLANPNPHPAEVLVRYLKPTFTVTRTYTLNPSSRHSVYANVDVPELGDGTFSVDVQVLNYQPIAVEKALYWNSGSEVFAGGTNVTATRLPPP